MKKMIYVILVLSMLLTFATCPSEGAETLVWKVVANLEYEHIRFFGELGFLAYTSDGRMFCIDENTGGVISETGPRGGFRSRFVYGFHPGTETFFYNLEYEYYPEEIEVVIQESQNTAVSVHEVKRIVQLDGSDCYEWKEDAKDAIYYNGVFVSDFVYDQVIGGNPIAIVMQNEKYAFADGNGNLITEFIYDDVALVAKGYVAVKKGDAWGFVDAGGSEVIPYIFEEAENIDAKTAFVKYNGKYGILDVKKTADNFHR